MKKFLNNLKRIKWDKKHISIFVLAIIVVSLSVVKISTAFLTPDYSDGAFVRAGVVSGDTDTLTFEKGDPISVHATPSFFTGSSNVTSTTYSSAILKTSSETTSSVSRGYDVYVAISNNSFEYTSGTTPEVLLTVTDPSETVVTSGVSAMMDGETLTYKTSGGVSGFDITEKSGIFRIKTNYQISSSSAGATIIHPWTFKVTIVKQSNTVNVGKTMNINVALTEPQGDYVRTLYDVLWDWSGGESVYTGSTEYVDSINGSSNNEIYYFTTTYGASSSSVLNQINVLFAGFCWQMIRTTDTGGVKLIYNGEPVDGACAINGSHTGIVAASWTNKNLSGGAYVYGEGFTYSGSTFTLTDTVTKTWSSSTYKDLIGKYTCGTNSSSCTTLYYVGPSTNTTYGYNASAIVQGYTISSTSYARIGTSGFNVGNNSPAGIGYMFNYYNRYTDSSSPVSNAIMGNDVEYKNEMYYLTGTSTTYDATHHYTCNSTTAISCTSVRYYYYGSYYITLSDGKNITETINAMLYDDDVNKYDSAMKKYLENWYKLNLTDYSSYLEDVIWCNDRSMTNKTTNGWYPNGGGTSTQIVYSGNSNTSNLSCTNETDRFSMANSKAKIKYPIGLLTYQEVYLLGDNGLRNAGSNYWTFSPYHYNYGTNYTLSVTNSGSIDNNFSGQVIGVRPSIALAPNVVVTGGDGSTSSPYTVGLLGE